MALLKMLENVAWPLLWFQVMYNTVMPAPEYKMLKKAWSFTHTYVNYSDLCYVVGTTERKLQAL
jgi:hypothetical protein